MPTLDKHSAAVGVVTDTTLSSTCVVIALGASC